VNCDILTIHVGFAGDLLNLKWKLFSLKKGQKKALKKDSFDDICFGKWWK
jgi:hypothetical protein